MAQITVISWAHNKATTVTDSCASNANMKYNFSSLIPISTYATDSCAFKAASTAFDYYASNANLNITAVYYRFCNIK